ncbi:MAG: DUF1566 domain-containing protein [Myxococcota bacterium]
MRKHEHVPVVAAVGLAMLMVVTGCGSSGQTPGPQEPNIDTFIADPNPALYGGKSSLTAIFTGGTGEINNGIGAVTSGVPVPTAILTAKTTYRLTVKGSGGKTASLDLDVNVQTVTISDISPANPSVSAGLKKAFTAKVTGAADSSVDWSPSVDTGCGSIDSSGMYNAPALEKSCSVTATSHADPTKSKTTNISVIPAPAVTSFSTAKSIITSGKSTTLVAVFSGGSGSIDHGVGNIESSTPVQVSPTASTTYTLTVTNAASDSATAQLTIVVVPPPSITSLAANPDKVTIGDNQKADLLAIFVDGEGKMDNDLGDIKSGTPKQTGPLNSTTTFTLTVTNPAGDTVNQQITVNAYDPPDIQSFTFSPANPVPFGGVVTFMASYTNGDGEIDNGVGKIEAGGTKNTPALIDDNKYTLTVTNPAGKAKAVGLDVYVVPQVVVGLGGRADSSTAAVLTWSNPLHPVPDHVEITYEPDSGATTAAKGVQRAFINNLSNPGTYTFTVKTVDAGGFKSSGTTFTLKPSIYCLTSQCLPLTPTDQIKCYDNSEIITCPASRTDAFFGQDAQFHKSRKFTCYNPDGSVQDPCAPTVTDGEVVTDSVSGLMWQRGMTSSNYLNAMAYCNTLDLAGHNDWRLPNPLEMVGIENNQNDPCIDLSVFPGTSNEAVWTSTTRPSDIYSACLIYFNNGTMIWKDKTWGHGIRCARAGSFFNGSVERYLVSAPVLDEQIVSDAVTGLTWLHGNRPTINWQEALSYCSALNYAGFSDWRLPNKNELFSLINLSRAYPASDFPNITNDSLWSSTTSTTCSHCATAVNFGDGLQYGETEKMNAVSVLCVRGP